MRKAPVSTTLDIFIFHSFFPVWGPFFNRSIYAGGVRSYEFIVVLVWRFHLKRQILEKEWWPFVLNENRPFVQNSGGVFRKEWSSFAYNENRPFLSIKTLKWFLNRNMIVCIQWKSSILSKLGRDFRTEWWFFCFKRKSSVQNNFLLCEKIFLLALFFSAFFLLYACRAVLSKRIWSCFKRKKSLKTVLKPTSLDNLTA